MEQRYKSATETLNIIKPLFKLAGITRLADLSYLDNSTSIFVYAAIRPNAKSLTSSMGKSRNKEQAKCSALIESLETYFAEEVKSTLNNISYNQLIRKNNFIAINYNQLGFNVIIDDNQELDWCLGQTLLSRNPVWIPYIGLTLDSNLLMSKIVGQNSDGLATGNQFKEAIIYSFLELIERISIKSNVKYYLENIDPSLLDYINNDQINIAFYSYENIFNIPLIECNILNKNPILNQSVFSGYACHFSKKTAIYKSLSEAIQSKTGVIAGVRDDLSAKEYNFRKINTLKTCPGKDFNQLNSNELSLDHQFIHIKNLLKLSKLDLVFYTYYKKKICIIKSFLLKC